MSSAHKLRSQKSRSEGFEDIDDYDSQDQTPQLVLQGPVRRTRMGPRTGPDCNLQADQQSWSSQLF